MHIDTMTAEDGRNFVVPSGADTTRPSHPLHISEGFQPHPVVVDHPVRHVRGQQHAQRVLRDQHRIEFRLARPFVE
ncbi:hypothetical protein CSX11_18945 [Mycobacterium goodii]|nr:hypothetical protein CSX11_18945 [Mycolicibacterium goodii]